MVDKRVDKDENHPNEQASQAQRHNPLLITANMLVIEIFDEFKSQLTDSPDILVYIDSLVYLKNLKVSLNQRASVRE